MTLVAIGGTTLILPLIAFAAVTEDAGSGLQPGRDESLVVAQEVHISQQRAAKIEGPASAPSHQMLSPSMISYSVGDVPISCGTRFTDCSRSPGISSGESHRAGRHHSRESSLTSFGPFAVLRGPQQFLRTLRLP